MSARSPTAHAVSKRLCSTSHSNFARRTFTTSPLCHSEAALQPTSFPALDPSLVSTPREERRLLRSGVKPIGSRRRRAALRTSQNIPFEHLPYQCFQEALKVIRADREVKLGQIETEQRRLREIGARDAACFGGEANKNGKLIGIHKHVENLKVLADINDPVIKKRFEDGQGDMLRPVYRYLALTKWQSYKRPLLIQRISQMNVVPDIIPSMDPTAAVRLSIRQREIPPGSIVPSVLTAHIPTLNIQVFDKYPRLVTVLVVDPDVPDVKKDSFKHRCHFLAINIPIDPNSASVPLMHLKPDEQIILPWLPPYAQKGSPYHRLATFVLEQPEGKMLDPAKAKERLKRDGFNFRSFHDRFSLNPIGIHLFRTVWDEGTSRVMEVAGIDGADIELKRKKPERLPERFRHRDGARFR